MGPTCWQVLYFSDTLPKLATGCHVTPAGKMITSSCLIRNLLFRTQSGSQGAPRISPAEMAPISLSVFESATVSKLFLKASDLECGRQEPSHNVTSPALAACSQRSSCLLFERTQWSVFQARNEFAQLKVLHHLSLIE